MRFSSMQILVGALAIGLTTPTSALAFGGAHVGYTQVGPNGVTHVGATAYGNGYRDVPVSGSITTTTYNRPNVPIPPPGQVPAHPGVAPGYRYAPSYGSATYTYVR
jgi:hypothetical protein